MVEDSLEDEVVPKSPFGDYNMGNNSPMRASPIKSNVEAIGGLDCSGKAPNVDTTINQGE